VAPTLDLRVVAREYIAMGQSALSSSVFPETEQGWFLQDNGEYCWKWKGMWWTYQIITDDDDYSIIGFCETDAYWYNGFDRWYGLDPRREARTYQSRDAERERRERVFSRRMVRRYLVKHLCDSLSSQVECYID
jgi:hypothetical protein